MLKSSYIIVIIFISFFISILNLPSAIDFKSNTSIVEIKGIAKEKNLINDNLNISSLFILGFDKYIYDINNKSIKFNLFFLNDNKNNNSFPNKLYLYLNINYKVKIIRNLQKNNVFKSICDLISNNNILDNIIKYECKLSTNGKEINNIKSLDIIEYNSQKIQVQNLSFLYTLYKDNIQNAKEDIFNKPLYILENSIVNNNQKYLNITGDLNINIDNLNNNQMILQFHLDKNKSNIINSTCFVINEGKSITNKVRLNCSFNESYYFNIIDGYSKLSKGNLFIIFINIENKEEMDEIETSNLRFHRQSSSSYSTGVIIGIIGGVIFNILIETNIIIYYCKRRKNNLQSFIQLN